MKLIEAAQLNKLFKSIKKTAQNEIDVNRQISKWFIKMVNESTAQKDG